MTSKDAIRMDYDHRYVIGVTIDIHESLLKLYHINAITKKELDAEVKRIQKIRERSRKRDRKND